jgi:hypothetical protein
MKSHAKVPILVNFLVKTELYEETHAVKKILSFSVLPL